MNETTLKWPMVPTPENHDFGHEWHVAINHHTDAQRKEKKEHPTWMYEAKTAAFEVPRLALLFAHEREGKLCKNFRACACCGETKQVEDNHLTCCLGTECRKCPHLLALEKAKLPAEQVDWIKAWTCAGHILSKGGDIAGEGFILTTDDRMFWDRIYTNLAMTEG